VKRKCKVDVSSMLMKAGQAELTIRLFSFTKLPKEPKLSSDSSNPDRPL